MASIEYTSYKFNEPPLISEDLYKKIKGSRNNFNPFKFSFIKSYFAEFKTGILFFVIGAPIAFLLALPGIGVLNVIAGIWCLLAFGLFFSGMLSTFSYFGFLMQKAFYNRKLMRNIKSSIDYQDFKKKMTR